MAQASPPLHFIQILIHIIEALYLMSSTASTEEKKEKKEEKKEKKEDKESAEPMEPSIGSCTKAYLVGQWGRRQGWRRYT